MCILTAWTAFDLFIHLVIFQRTDTANLLAHRYSSQPDFEYILFASLSNTRDLIHRSYPYSKFIASTEAQKPPPGVTASVIYTVKELGFVSERQIHETKAEGQEPYNNADDENETFYYNY